jgi:hypothetical protein
VVGSRFILMSSTTDTADVMDFDVRTTLLEATAERRQADRSEAMAARTVGDVQRGGELDDSAFGHRRGAFAGKVIEERVVGVLGRDGERRVGEARDRGVLVDRMQVHDLDREREQPVVVTTPSTVGVT